jgi:hypothetical protein
MNQRTILLKQRSSEMKQRSISAKQRTNFVNEKRLIFISLI